MFTVRNSRVIYIADEAHVTISFISRDSYFLHIYRKTYDVQGEFEELSATNLLNRPTNLPQIETVYGEYDEYYDDEEDDYDYDNMDEENDVVMEASAYTYNNTIASIKVLAAAAVEVNIAPDGSLASNGYNEHKVVGTRVSEAVSSFDFSAVESWRVLHDTHGYVILTSIPTRRVYVDVIVHTSAALEEEYEWNYYLRARDIIHALFPNVPRIDIKEVRADVQEIAEMLRFVRVRGRELLRTSTHVETIEINGTTVYAVQLGCDDIAVIRLGFEWANYKYPSLEWLEREFDKRHRIWFVEIELDDGVYYVLRDDDSYEWYVAKKVKTKQQTNTCGN